MKPTRKRFLVYIGVIGLLCGVSMARVVLATSGTLMPVRPAAPLATGVMAIALLWWTIIVRSRLIHIARARHDAEQKAKGGPAAPFIMTERPLEPLVAARTLALAFAMSRAGAYVCGWYAGVALSFSGHLGSDDVRWRLLYAVMTSVFSLLLVVIAIWLERSCKLPPTAPGVEASPA